MSRETQYHKKIKYYIYEYGEEFSRVKQVFKGSERPITISYPHAHTKKSKLTDYYEPDVFYILKHSNKYVIFEIVESQEIYKTISDWIRTYLCDHIIHSIYFIIEDEEKIIKMENTLDIISTRLNRIIKINDRQKFVHRAVHIPKSIIKSEEKIYKLLDKEIKEKI